MNKKLETKNIGKLIVEYSIPAILGMIVTVLYSVVDTIFIGHKLGTESLAGISMVFPLSRIINSVSVLISAGGGVLISIALGKKDKEKGARILGNQILLAITLCLGIIITLAVLLPNFFSSNPANSLAVKEAVTYGRIFLFCAFFNTITKSYNGAMRAQGYPKLVLLTSIVSSIANIVLDYIFMFPLNMGIEGAALASLIASIIPLFIITYILLKDSSLIQIRLKYLKLDLEVVKSILKLGLATAVIPFANGALVGVFNIKLMVLGGTTAIAAYGIYMTIHSVVLMISSGISIGVQPIISHNIGAKRYDRVSEAIKLSLKYGIFISFGVLILIQLFPSIIMKSFIKDPATIKIGIEALRYGFIMIPIMISTIMIAGVYRSLGNAKLAFSFNLLRKVLVIFPVLLILTKFLGIKGVWLTRPVSDTISFLIMFPALLKTLKVFSKKENFKS